MPKFFVISKTVRTLGGKSCKNPQIDPENPQILQILIRFERLWKNPLCRKELAILALL